MARAFRRIGISTDHGSPMCLASRICRIPASFDDPTANTLVLIGLPKLRGPARLNTAEMLAPLGIRGSSPERGANGRSMFQGIEIRAVSFVVMQTNWLGCFQSRNVGRPVVAAIKIHVMAMCTGDVIVNFVPQIPLISQSVSGIQMPVDRLIYRFIAADQVPVQWHQRVTGAKGMGGCHTSVSPHEKVIGGCMNSLASV